MPIDIATSVTDQTGLTSGLRLLVIIPAYNEERTILTTLRELDAVLADLEGGRVELANILMIDDGSTDQTFEIAKTSGLSRLLIARHKVNKGLGSAIRTAIEVAKYKQVDLVVKIDADGQHDPNDIPAMLEPLLEDKADIVYGHRWDRISYTMPWMRQIGNWVFTGLSRYLTGWDVKDSQPGIFALNKDCIRCVRLPGDYNYTQQILLSANLAQMRFAHADVAFRERRSGTSFISLRYPFKVLLQVLWVVLGAKPLRVFGSIGGISLLISTAIFGFEAIEWILTDKRKVVENVNLVLGTLFFGLQTLMIGLIGQMFVNQNRLLSDSISPDPIVDRLIAVSCEKQKSNASD